jgi:hypothetical protein
MYDYAAMRDYAAEGYLEEGYLEGDTGDEETALCSCGSAFVPTETERELCPACLEGWWDDYDQAMLAADYPF